MNFDDEFTTNSSYTFVFYVVSEVLHLLLIDVSGFFTIKNINFLLTLLHWKQQLLLDEILMDAWNKGHFQQILIFELIIRF